jgi:predicted DNA binding CopG/RHH family protein
MKSTFKLTTEEQEIERELEKGAYISVPASKKDKELWAAMARHTLEKTKAVHIRLTEKNLIKVKAAAAKEGLPYQTFIASLIHKNV